MKAVWTILGWWTAAAAAGGGAGMLEAAPWSGGDEFLVDLPFDSESWPAVALEGDEMSMGSPLAESPGADMVMAGGAESGMGTTRPPIDEFGRSVVKEAA